MGGWSGIYFRYDIADKSFEDLYDDTGDSGKRFKGIIGNHYKGFEPYHILIRGVDSVLEAIGCLGSLYDRDTNEIIKRTIDVDFISKTVEVRRYEETDTEYFFFNDDNYYGGFMIDINGYVNKRIANDEGYESGRDEHGLNIKYAFVDDTQSPELIMSARQYYEHFSQHFYYDQERLDMIEEAITRFEAVMTGDNVHLMTMEELKEYISLDSLKEYMQYMDEQNKD